MDALLRSSLIQDLCALFTLRPCSCVFFWGAGVSVFDHLKAVEGKACEVVFLISSQGR